MVPARTQEGHRFGAEHVIEVSEEQGAELHNLLESALGDLSSESTGTDTAEYRPGLRHRRAGLESVLFELDNPARAAD